MIITLYIILVLYGIVMTWIFIGMIKLPYFKLSSNKESVSFSIVIPFRNEEKHLPELIASLLQIQYGKTKFEVLFVDDASEDSSVKIIEDLLKNSEINYSILENTRYSNSPKKDAISMAIKIAKHKWIVTTDADCKVPKKWLLLLSSFIKQEKPKMICMPVFFLKDATFLKQYQFFDVLSLQATTMGGFGNNKPLLSNGANLAYKKNTFFEVAGYIENDIHASGDDIFLMEKIRELYPKKVKYLKNPEAAVITHCVNSWKEIIQQRIRWASKTKYIKNNTVTLVGSIAFISNFAIIISLICCFIFPLEVFYFIPYILLKILMDSIILVLEAKFLKQKINVFNMFLSSLIYSFIVVWVTFNSINGDYQWKGRTFKK